ncbi:unnamed protein product [Caenorhabditis angaria]|uniref:Uncharacterized protein n=1 Tax=Caenorhabditis angaria TaxID=860376 RepID=A0A9P1IA96_9PELO|nr:unnamed protein product [Caenorhabditis angaria]
MVDLIRMTKKYDALEKRDTVSGNLHEKVQEELEEMRRHHRKLQNDLDQIKLEKEDLEKTVEDLRLLL